MADPKDPPPEDPPRVLPDIDFATFILSLGSSALQHLGEVPDGDGKKELDLPLAKQTIDLLALIEEKTKGNLDSTEKQLLSGLLYDLRIKYVDARKR